MLVVMMIMMMMAMMMTMMTMTTMMMNMFARGPYFILLKSKVREEIE